LRYDLQGIAKGFGYSAKAELLWQPDASQYEARLEVSHFLLGSRVQTSQGQIIPEGLAPRRFGDKVRSEQAAHFQRDKGLITYSANTPDTPLLAGMQDRLSVFIQISGILLAEPQRWGSGAVMNFNATGARDSEPWAFQVAGMETLKMPYGTLEALRLVRQEQKQYDQRVELWMSPSLERTMMSGSPKTSRLRKSPVLGIWETWQRAIQSFSKRFAISQRKNSSLV
jgi:hypothetical protein